MNEPTPTNFQTAPQANRFDYYCTACGKKRKGSERCPACGALKDEQRYRGIVRVGAGGIGYSDKTDDPTFTQSKKKLRILSLPISLGIGLLIFVILLATGVKPGPAAFFGGVMFLVFFIPLLLYGRKKKSWEGEVVDKNYVHVTGNASRSYHVIKFVTVDGKKTKQILRTSSDLYDYLMPGDRVRYVGEIGRDFAYEKYDKSKDANITCANCGCYQDPRGTYCSTCGCLLLKGNPVIR